MKKIIVTGAGGYASIGFCRCLKSSKENYYLIGTDIDPFKILFAHTHKRYLVPKASSKSFLKVMNKIVEKEQADFLHVQTDTEIAALVKIKDRLKTKTFLPYLKTVELGQDKYKTQSVLNRNRVPVPESILIRGKSDIKKAFNKLDRPIWFRAIKGAGGKGSLLVEKEEIAISWVTHWKGFGCFMACKYLPGKNIGWDSIWHQGRLIISHTKERLSYARLGAGSPSGITGTAGAIRSVERKEVDDICERAILALDSKPDGAFAVDLKEDNQGKPFVTEINPGRFLTSSLHFFAETGYDLPGIFVKLAFGEKIDLSNLKKPTGKYMIRSLDVLPIVFDDRYITRILKELKNKDFVKVS